MSSPLIDAIANLEEEKSLDIVRARVRDGDNLLDIVEQCRLGVEQVGRRYGDETYYLSDLIMSEEIFKGAMEILEPYFKNRPAQTGMNIVFGTIEGDIHDLGKNIIIHLLRTYGFTIHDLGVDVKPESFIQKIIETESPILCISVVLTFSINYVKKLIRLLEEIGLRKRVTVVIGGHPVNEMIRDYTGADYYENDTHRAIALIKGIAASLEKIRSV